MNWFTSFFINQGEHDKRYTTWYAVQNTYGGIYPETTRTNEVDAWEVYWKLSGSSKPLGIWIEQQKEIGYKVVEVDVKVKV